MASPDIRTGHWVDWTKGNAVTGATVTLSLRGGGFLLAFIILWVIFVTSQVWFIIRFLLHQSLATDEPHDALHFQKQAIYRNSSSRLSSVKVLYKLHKAQKPEDRKRTRSAFLLALGFTVASIAFALFSSAIVGWSSEYRLLHPKNCGYWYTNDKFAQVAQESRENLAAASYAQECYEPETTNFPTCNNYFPVPRLSDKVTPDSEPPCPFKDPNICAVSPGQKQSMLFSAPSIDSILDLGINESPSNRITYSRSLSCHILNTTGHTNNQLPHYVIKRPLDELIAYGYGESNRYRAYGKTHTYGHNFTEANSTRTFTTALFDSHPGVRHHPFGWIPIPELHTLKDEGSMYLILLSQNYLRHSKRNNAPAFSASTVHPDFPLTSVNSDGARFLANDPVVPIACVETHQVCFVKQGVCTPKVGRKALERAIYNIRKKEAGNNLNKIQEAIAARIENAAERSGLADVLSTRLSGGSWLKASEYIGREREGEISQEIPSNQFELEIRRVFYTCLAKFQRLVMRPVTGLYGVEKEENSAWEKNGWVYRKETCNSQRVRAGGTGTMNFSSLGMGIVFGFGLVLIISRMVIVRLFGKKREMWERDGVLELQRSLFEVYGEGGKENLKFRYPVLKKGEEE
ncbi:hypothetical protein QBC38DRAFT_502621 [Podospora fimiseda]|uniref:Uncharacterized protein n=1 Tax=Podospora fimiseda TaxID=252190 RepID=A0AAN7BIP9_9PEZI|nr:hypothetical protein QBC38DRAFT_502621 [Podospora fimiseda]